MNEHSNSSSGFFAVSSDDVVFGPFRLFPTKRLLLEDDVPVALGSRSFDILTVLADRPGEVLSKDELLSRVWPGVFVDEGNLRVHVAALRKALRDGQAGRRYIVTAPGRGYSLAEPVIRNAGTSPATPAAPARDNLPSLFRSVVGRDEIVSQLAAKLPLSRFITVVGPGGIGKTTVALKVAVALRSAYPDGVWLVDLAPIVDPALMPTVLASVLGTPVSSRDPIPNLLTFLCNKQMLLVLDNCEHVVDAAATLVAQVFRSTSSVHVLATSREAFRVEGENVWPLSPLEAPSNPIGMTAEAALTFPAVQLFVQQAAATCGSFKLSETDAPIVGEICHRLDGMALAIELAAARVNSLGVSGVAARLDDRFRLLTRGYRTALPRHQTLRATFDWSYHLLDEFARVVLRRLSLLAGDFVMITAVAIAQGADLTALEVEDEVTALVATSLLSVVGTEAAVHYRLLESTRAYAQERLRQSGELAESSRQHAEHFCRVLRGAGENLGVWPATTWKAEYGHQIDNVRASLDWAFSPDGDRDLAIDLTISAAPLWSLMSLNEECSSRVEMALAYVRDDEDRRGRRAMQLWAALGGAHMYTRNPGADAAVAWSKTLEIAEVLQDTEYRLRALKGLWSNAFNASDFASALRLGKTFEDVASLSADPAYIQLSDRMRGMAEYYTGQFEVACLYSLRAYEGYTNANIELDLLRFQFDQRMISATILASTLWILGLPDQATRIAQSSMYHARKSGHDLSVTYALAYVVIRLSIQTGDFEAVEFNLKLLSQYAALNPGGQWELHARCWKGSLLCNQGDFVAGAELLGRALDEIPEHAFRLNYTQFLGEFAHATAVLGDVEKGSETIDRALRLCEESGERWSVSELLRLKGEICLLSGSPGAKVAAAECFVQSLDLARQQGAQSWELRTAMSFARLNKYSGNTKESVDQLRTVYNRYSEGFETIDLRAAKSLLDTLRV